MIRAMIGTVAGRAPPEVAARGPDAELALNLKQGRVPFGVDMTITDDEDRRLPHDGRTPGHLRVQGPAKLLSGTGALAEFRPKVAHRSTSPMTGSTVEMTVTVSDMVPPRINSGTACKLVKLGARVCIRYGFGPPSETM